MAGRVNTKFVIALVAAVVLVLGAGLFLFAMMVNKTGETHAAKAREFEAAGDWESAEETWGRAVGHEKTNVEWLRNWRDALGHIVPETQTEYGNEFASYLQISKQIAATLRNDADEVAAYFELRSAFFRRLGNSNRPVIEQFVNELDGMLVNFPEGGSTQDQRDRLRRYRGIAWSSLSGPDSTLTEDEVSNAQEDLLAAIGVNPGDGEAVRALLELLETQRQRADSDKQVDEVDRLAAEKHRVVDELLAADPENAWGRVSRLEMEFEGLQSLPEATRAASQAELNDRLSTLYTWVGEHAATVDSRVFERMTVLEALNSEGADISRSVDLYTKAAEQLDDRTDLLLALSSLKNQTNDFDGAVELMRRVELQPDLPVSVEGRLRLIYKVQAPIQIAEYAVMRINEVQDSDEVNRLLEMASGARGRYVDKVGSESPNVAMLDGQVALAQAELARRDKDNRAAQDAFSTALGYFSRYNELTDFSNADGLWREGRTAIILNKTGLARQRFEKLRELDPKNSSVLLALAEVEEKLGTPSNLNEALLLVGQAAELRPGSELILSRLERLRQLVGETVSDDPIEAVIFESERLATGTDGQSPDAIAAERSLREAMEAYPSEPRLIKQFVRVLVISDRLDEARSFVSKARDEFPDNADIENLALRLEAGSMLDLIIRDIEESGMPELGKLLRKIEVYRAYGEPEKSKAELVRAAELAPDDPDVLEQQFLQVLVAGDLESAMGFAQKAEETNADKLDGITFQARLMAARGQHGDAVELLREAVSRRSTEAPLWRLLASEQAVLGRINDSVESFRRALEITENDPSTIRGYVATLASAGRNSEALTEARRLRDYGKHDPAFLDVYLRLEAGIGGAEGRLIAIERRRQLLGERPFDAANKLELADLYIDNRQWDESRKLIDELEADYGDSLRRVEVLAKWYAEQGRVRVDGDFKDGIELARGAFINFIVSHDVSEVGVEAYIAMARFMMMRGRDDVAMRAVEEARPLQDPSELRAEKLFGEIMMRRNLPRQASEAFAKVVEAGADSQGDTYRKLLIEMLLRINDYDVAEGHLDALGDGYADDLTVLMQRTDIAMYRSQTEGATKLVERAILAHPSSSLPYIKRAQILMADENLWRDAQRNLEEALRISPNDYQAHKLLATMHFREGRSDDAIRSLRSSLEINPGQDALLLATLIELIEAGREGEALDVANEVIDKRPSDATLMLIAGRVFTQRESWGRATVLFERAWQLTKDERVAMAYINALLASTPPKTKEAARVVLELERLGAKINENPVLLATRALIEQRDGKSARAQSFLSRAYEKAVGNPGLVMQWLGDVRRVFSDSKPGDDVVYVLGLREKMPVGSDQHDWLTYGAALIRIQIKVEIEGAESDLNHLKADANNDLIRRLSHRLLGSGRYSRKEYESAAEAWGAGIEVFPNDWEMHNNLAYCLGIDLNRPAEGVLLARQATQLNSARADVFDTLGSLLLKTGELDEAEDALLAARERLQTERERVNVLLNLARLALARDEIEKAMRLWTQADTAVYTLPNIRESVQENLDEVKEQIRSAQGLD